jgi:hypothetical protein
VIYDVIKLYLLEDIKLITKFLSTNLTNYLIIEGK